MAFYFLKEIVSFYRFSRRISKTEKAIVFYSEHKDYYPYFEGIVKELVSKYGQTLCYVTSDPNDPILQKSEPQIKTFYLNKLLSLFMSLINCKIFVMTLADLNQFHLKRSVNPVHYIYVFHSLVSTHMVYRYGAFDYYDSILCGGPHQIKEIRKHEELTKLPAKKLIKAGYYRLERIYGAYQKYLQKKPISSKKVTLLIAPSWGAANVLESCGEHLVELLLEADYKVIVRPHPETVKRSPNLIALFDSKFSSNPNFTMEMSVATDDSLMKADVLISDWSGIAFEYAFGTERPVLFLDVPPKIKNKKFNELGIEPIQVSLRSKIGIVVSPKKLRNIPEELSKLIKNKENYKRAIQELRNKYVFAFGESSKIGAQHIIDILE